MIISRTPFRISFFGGGTDYPAWYRENGGSVLATAIDKYCYISCRNLPPFFEYKHRVVYSQVEYVKSIDEIKHPAVRGVLGFMKRKNGIEIHHDGDLPARAGLGSSSTFTVGLIHAVKALEGQLISKRDLANAAIHVEQKVLKECVGLQDTITASYGGFNRIEFRSDDTFEITPITIRKERIDELRNHLMLFFTGFSRLAPEIAKEQVKNFGARKKQLTAMHEMVDEGISILNTPKTSLDRFGKLLHDSWQLKRSLASNVTTSAIDEIYDTARRAGAVGGKILGAGGGGFFLFFAKPEDQKKIRQALKHLVHVGFRFEPTGSKIVIYETDDFK